MKTLHRTALIATALCALVAAPAANAGEPVLSVSQYANYAKAVNGADKAAAAGEVKNAVAEAVAAAGEKAQQAAAEAVAAMSAVSTVKAGTDAAAAAEIAKAAVAAAAAASSDKAEALSLAKVAAAAVALVSGGADFAKTAADGLPKAVAKEVKAANADEALADVDADTVKNVYETVLEILRGGAYKMKEDSAAAATGIDAMVGDAAGASAKANADGAMGSVMSEMEDVTGFSSYADTPTLEKDGVYVPNPSASKGGKTVVVPKPHKKPDNPTKTELK